jgi:hypothetical protein
MVVIVQQDARESLHFMAVLFINTAASSFVARIKAVAQTTKLCCYVDTDWNPL